MTPRKKAALGITMTLTVVIITAYSVFLSMRSNRPTQALIDFSRRDPDLRVRLLCNTDYKELLRAGREILSQLPEGYLTVGPEGRRFSDRAVPEGIQIPQVIRDLQPHTVLIYHEGYLIIEMHGGMDHFGVRIYPDDFKEPHADFEYGGRELAPGLWYYDDGYLYNSEYDKIIETLIEEHENKPVACAKSCTTYKTGQSMTI